MLLPIVYAADDDDDDNVDDNTILYAVGFSLSALCTLK